jgi:hypothetical protein
MNFLEVGYLNGRQGTKSGHQRRMEGAAVPAVDEAFINSQLTTGSQIDKFDKTDHMYCKLP